MLAGALLGGGHSARSPRSSSWCVPSQAEPDAPIAAEVIAARGDELAQGEGRALARVAAPLAPARTWRAGSGTARTVVRLREVRRRLRLRDGRDGAPRRAGSHRRARRCRRSPPVRQVLDACGAPRSGRNGAWYCGASAARGCPRERAPPAVVHEVAWLRVIAPGGGGRAAARRLPSCAPTAPAQPIAFDDDGFAIVPGVPPGGHAHRLRSGNPGRNAEERSDRRALAPPTRRR